MTEDSGDPHRHWTGTEWLRWAIMQWVPETPPSTGAPEGATDRDNPQLAAEAQLAHDEVEPENEEPDRKARRLARLQSLNDKLAGQRLKQAHLDGAGVIYVGESHDEGRNAIVALYADRIERVQAKKLGGFGKAHRDHEIIPLRMVTGISVKKSGLRSDVVLIASGSRGDVPLLARRISQIQGSRPGRDA